MQSIRFFAVFLGLILISGTTISSPSFADVISPKQQMKLNFTAEQIVCAEGLVKVFKKTNGNASCVKPTTAEKLAQNGWAKILSEKKLDEIKVIKLKRGEPAGTITKIATAKQTTQPVKAGTPAGVSGYAYVFEACSTSKVIRAPEIYVTSDSETKSVKLGSMLNPNSCYTSSVLIKAADPNSISATLLNKGGISEKIQSLETQIADLKSKISTAKQNLPKSQEQTPSTENINDLTTMKKDLKNLQDELRRYLMALYVPTTAKASKLDIPKSLTGQPLEGMSSNLISVTESVAKSESSNPDMKRFNVIFEACAGKDPVRLPIITVTSDSESVDVKLVERIVEETCQVAVTRINALDSESIMTKISGNSGLSSQVAVIEKQVEDLQTMLSEKRSELDLLVAKKLDSTTEPIAAKLAMEISELRNELLKTRAQLYGLLLQN